MTRPIEGVIRVTVGGPDFHDFVSTGPTDHVRLFFPDTDGTLVAPTAVGDGEDGIVRPVGPTINRDYTPLAPTGTHDVGTVDLEFMEHENAGPATLWASGAVAGDQIVVVGPRGSKAAPTGIDGLLAIVDVTALPALSRWIAEIPEGSAVAVVAALDRDTAWLEGYLRLPSGHAVDLRVVAADPAGDELLRAVGEYGPIGERTYVFAAGEATALTPVRRHLLGERALPSEQVAISGYWRRGVVAFDHHTPLEG